ncbi:MAG TPA: hypothetical protein VFP27_19875, partial [Mycobacterium sp.]|nr:hypothetical protein [Mycobacterium sp.]
MDKTFGDVGTALFWCYLALRQAERVRESFDEFLAAGPAGQEADRLDFLYWGDAHFLMAATHHMNEALERLPSGQKLPKRLRAEIAVMRHTIEHWDDQSARTGRWQTLADEHGEHATPWLVVGMDNDIEIGPAHISLDGLERLLEPIRDELLEIYPGMPRAIQSDAVDRAVAGIWAEQLGLNNG